jgi:heterodisulfide reductase subunit C
MSFKKFKAVSFLGWHVVLHFVKKITTKLPNGMATFLNNYRADRIFAISPAIRAQMPSYSACYACRLCDTVCPELTTKPNLMAPSYIVSSFSRSLPDYAHFNPAHFDCGTCQECDTICPQHVPIRDIVAFMTDKAKTFQA